MIRKHNRRAAKAAFSIALGVAIILGGAAAAPAAQTQSTPIIVGAKNFPEQYVLGQLYRQALIAAGYRVQYKENIGSTELIDAALRNGQVTIYPEYTGIMLTATFKRKSTPNTARATYRLAKRLYERRGQTLLGQTRFQDRDVLAVTRATANRYGLRTIADLRRVPNLTISGFPEWETRWRARIGREYGVRGFEFEPLAGISSYQLLDQGDVEVADVFTTDPQLLGNKYRQLRDPKNMFGFQYVAPVVDRDLLRQYGAKFRNTVNKVSRLLTVRAMQAMLKAVVIDQRPPARVADAFLEANDLK
ncbi:MAG: glycine betaine ABC transporter substrate-binding protein [Gaiellaceae bacterium]